MMRSSVARSSILLAFIFSTACADISSQDILTSGICADFVVSNDMDNSDQVNVVGELTAGCGLFATYVDLSGGDQLNSIYISSTRQMMRQGGFFGDISYRSVYPLASQPYTAGTNVFVDFIRSVHESAPGSYVTLPEKITTLTLTSTNFLQTDSVTANWSAPSGPYRIEARIDVNGCNYLGDPLTVSSTSYFSSDTASYVFRLSDYLSPGEDCSGGSGSVRISRVKNGVINAAYEGGTIKAKYTRRVNFTVQ